MVDIVKSKECEHAYGIDFRNKVFVSIPKEAFVKLSKSIGENLSKTIEDMIFLDHCPHCGDKLK